MCPYIVELGEVHRSGHVFKTGDAVLADQGDAELEEMRAIGVVSWQEPEPAPEPVVAPAPEPAPVKKPVAKKPAVRKAVKR